MEGPHMVIPMKIDMEEFMENLNRKGETHQMFDIMTHMMKDANNSNSLSKFLHDNNMDMSYLNDADDQDTEDSSAQEEDEEVSDYTDESEMSSDSDLDK